MTEISRCLGILNLDLGFSTSEPPRPPRPRSLMNPETFNMPVIVEVVPGATVEKVVQGDPSLEPAILLAAQRLLERGAIVISSNCGFFVRHQGAVAAAVNVPVVLSTLLLAPTLLLQLPVSAKLAVVTYDSRHCTEDLLGVSDPAQRKRVIVGGIEGGKYWHDGIKRPLPPTDVEAIENDVRACITRLRTLHPEIAAILLECTAFPLAAPALRRTEKLPVYDITDLCRMTIASLA
ncbi:hypothetical protein H8A99_39265 [Bradyrhizobium sp. Arg68]|uniref:hypothetical protein n=1 Tax=Bradyrhizobium ivorense TaxID=2511166 RepID=UPI001E4FFE3E|nr:hypothetical protein [Bradyrhizobium ivorense]MCC8942291.1 hypothetical protein [Bradyrhizobium ivorense]